MSVLFDCPVMAGVPAGSTCGIQWAADKEKQKDFDAIMYIL
jgi:hypothetical protein